MLKEKDWRRGRTRKENEFYTKPNNGGIIKKSLPGIDEIKQSIEAAERRAKVYENEWLDSVVNNADTRKIDAAKTRMEQAKSSVVSLNEQLSDAYGLGEDGYWNTQRPARSVQMENNPDHAYAIGNSTTAAAKPQSAYAAGTKAATAQPKTQGQTAAQNTSNTSAASRRMEWDIAQLQDEIVHGQDLSDYKKGQLNDKLAKLVSQKEVLDWENAYTGTPTAADYEVRENYYQRLWNQNQDDIMAGLGNNTLVQGSDEWYAILKKGDDLLEKRDAYRMGKMGLLGEESTNSAIQTDNGQTSGEETPQTQDEPKEEDSNLVVDFINEFPERIISTISDIREGAVNVVEGGIKWLQDNAETISEAQEKAAAEEERILNTPLNELNLEDLKKREKLETNMLEEEYKAKIEEEIARQIDEKKQECIDRYKKLPIIIKNSLETKGIATVEEYIEFVFEEESWEEKIEKSVDHEFEKLFEEDLNELMDKLYPYNGFEYVMGAFQNDEIVTEVINGSLADSKVNPDVDNLVDLSDDLNGVIKRCCDEFEPTSGYTDIFSGIKAAADNALVWQKGIFNHWNFVGDTLWEDNPKTGYDSYIPDEIQALAQNAQEDYFIVNGYRMNREQWNNYVKGATAQYAFPEAPVKEIIDILDIGITVFYNIRDDIKQENRYSFTWENMIEDSYFMYLGALDMRNGVFE